MKHTSTPNILYIDDDNDDCIFLSESFAESASHTDLICSPSGEEAISYLNSIDEAALPSLIILDLNMPKWDGRSMLHYLKSIPSFANIPVVILSTSANKTDRDDCTLLGAVSYLQKPYHFTGYRAIVDNCLPLMRTAAIH